MHKGASQVWTAVDRLRHFITKPDKQKEPMSAQRLRSNKHLNHSQHPWRRFSFPHYERVPSRRASSAVTSPTSILQLCAKHRHKTNSKYSYPKLEVLTVHCMRCPHQVKCTSENIINWLAEPNKSKKTQTERYYRACV